MSIDLDEDAAIRRLTEQLKAIYGDRRTPDEIETAVAEARESFSALQIRAHVPVLVERKARRILDGQTG
ncbi:three-helix bundle dimerization domain-containing protein [Streptomyces sp. NPDC005799]|uniref:three-helix bundle dimerization domain-containing protein n=1 Tax=Streptomyces sp. NPDC005799 TaxID=3154678 RepID=UPI0033F4B570